MTVEQIYTDCIAEAAYYIVANGEAAIIDPLREIAPYLERLERDGVKLKYIFETHFHADFVSGHVDLAKKTEATIVYGPTAKADFDFHMGKDNEVFNIGNISLKLLHTPGHTLESSSFLLTNENGDTEAVFTGDTLFLGDVGRPDLAVKSDLSKEDLAGLLFESLRNKIMTLPDSTTVYPGHGAGSSCGKSLSAETVGTIGDQKQTNYALRASMTKKEFVAEVTDGMLPPPQYFPKNAMLNKTGYENIDNVIERGNVGLSVSEFKKEIENGAIVLDTRHETLTIKGFVPKSLLVAIDGNFAMWVGALITDIKQKIVFIAEQGREHEVVKRLARVGYDYAVGYLKGGIEAWQNAGGDLDMINSISPEAFREVYQKGKINIIDVRKPGEYDSKHISEAVSFPLDYIFDNLDTLDKDKEYYVHCKGGYRSVIALSILQPYGFKNLINVEKGFDDIAQLEGFNMTTQDCASTIEKN